jgi:DNA-binding NtrC family response regulator
MSDRPTVLIVDDEERFRSTMRKLLTAEGLQASICGSAIQALEELRKNHYDIVILDVRMPEMTGVEALPKIKQIDPTIEVIILTGHASVETAKSIMKSGAYDYLLKPYSIETLLEKIDAAYDRKISRKQLTNRPTSDSHST